VQFPLHCFPSRLLGKNIELRTVGVEAVNLEVGEALPVFGFGRLARWCGLFRRYVDNECVKLHPRQVDGPAQKLQRKRFRRDVLDHHERRQVGRSETGENEVVSGDAKHGYKGDAQVLESYFAPVMLL
jgi:hypothetical protein